MERSDTAKVAAANRVLRQLSERERRQATCGHNFKTVPGTTAYLQCPKCGMRCDND